jgi:hypothetical protein
MAGWGESETATQPLTKTRFRQRAMSEGDMAHHERWRTPSAFRSYLSCSEALALIRLRRRLMTEVLSFTGICVVVSDRKMPYSDTELSVTQAMRCGAVLTRKRGLWVL